MSGRFALGRTGCKRHHKCSYKHQHLVLMVIFIAELSESFTKWREPQTALP